MFLKLLIFIVIVKCTHSFSDVGKWDLELSGVSLNKFSV